MDESTENEHARTRVLGLGNEILADDAFGILAAHEVGKVFPRQVDVVCTSAAGFAPLDHLPGAQRLIVIDTIVTGHAEPGTIYTVTADQMRTAPGIGPHFLGIFEVLALGRELDSGVPENCVVIAVEAADCSTVGGPMHPAVRAAIRGVVNLVGEILGGG
jgi:hydrogenase maturation protease